jgi:tRNA(His) guanylyltransferase
MADTSALGDRMKLHESAARAILPRRTYTICRADGRAFHSLLRHAAKPFDAGFAASMDAVAAALCAEISGSVLAYVQSDEVSVLACDFGSVHTEPWFGGVVQKMASIAAATATSAYAARYFWNAPAKPPVFDARVFTLPSAVEVANYFVWRQRDAVRNSISMAAQAHFSHTSLHGLNGAQMQERLFAEAGVNWNDYPDGFRRGRVVRKVTAPEDISYTDKRSGAEVTASALRSRWVTEAAPHFTASPDGFLAAVIPSLPSLGPSRAETPSPRSWPSPGPPPHDPDLTQ